MNVKKMLIHQDLERLQDQSGELKSELVNFRTPEALILAQHIDKKMRQLMGLQLTLDYVDGKSHPTDLEDLYHALRQVKLELRLVKRKWKKVLTVESRFRRADHSAQICL